ncbi:MAG: alpha/beta fold hydrolase [Candidatus Levybacteria bacterium]|nr:alpha/beta fold hydrolase [Candidatus Levybacteria bacterium]
MIKAKLFFLFVISLIIGTAIYFRFYSNSQIEKAGQSGLNEFGQLEDDGGLNTLHPLSIQALREGNYPGSDIVIEETLAPGVNYQRYIASYKSEGFKIYALLTVPNGDPSTSSGQGKPKNGWPVIIFNHGYIPPKEYQTTERYVVYIDAFSRNGYIVFKPDYRGHGNSEGTAAGAYGSSAYTVDILNAVSSMKKYKDADPLRIGMWGHSMGGHITIRAMVVSKDIKVGVIWAGVVASYPDLINNWRRSTFTPQPLPSGARRWRQELVEKYGSPEENPAFWNSISANSFLSDISGPLQLHHGTADASVPVEFSEKLAEELKREGKEVELYVYDGDDHNIAGNLYTALERSVAFFDNYLK